MKTMEELREDAKRAGLVLPSDEELAKMVSSLKRPNLGLRVTHTYALLEVSDQCYEEIKYRLLAVEYGHTISDDEINMHGIALVKESQHTGASSARAAVTQDLPACPRCKSMDLARRGSFPNTTEQMPTHAVTNFICQKCGLGFTSDDIGKNLDRRK